MEYNLKDELQKSKTSSYCLTTIMIAATPAGFKAEGQVNAGEYGSQIPTWFKFSTPTGETITFKCSGNNYEGWGIKYNYDYVEKDLANYVTKERDSDLKDFIKAMLIKCGAPASFSVY